MFAIIHTLTVLLWQATEPIIQQPPGKGWLRESLATFAELSTPILVIGVLVTVAYFFWHSRGREEITKHNAELIALSNTRLETIKDLRADKTDLELELSKAVARILDLENVNEGKAKIEFRLRGEIQDLERALQAAGASSDTSGK